MIALLISFVFAGYIAYVSEPGSTLFSWHPTMMSLAFMIFVAQAVLMMSPKGLLGSSSLGSRVTAHWIMMLCAVVSTLAGFTGIYLSKEKFNRPHLATPHSQLGAVVIVYLLVQCCAGANIIFPALATKFVPLGTLKRMHRFSGLFLYLLAMFVLLGGITTDWFKERVTGIPWYLCLATPIVMWALLAFQCLRMFASVESSKKNQ